MTTDETAARGGSAIGPLPFDPSVANQARIYDYLLGGKDNYAADRVATEALLKAYPDGAFTAQANRAFLGRAVRYLTGEAGIRQFLDIGTGIPTAGNLHQVAQEITPSSRVLYVDYDPIVLAHARALLVSAEEGATEYIEADLRDTDAILERAREFLDFSQPVAVTLLTVLHAIPDVDQPHAIVAKLLGAVPSGSYLAVSHLGADLMKPEELAKISSVSDRMVQQDICYRSREQVTRFFDGTDIVGPGVVRLEEWHPTADTVTTERSGIWCAVGKKR